MNLQNYNKAFVPIIVAAVLFVLNHFHITGNMSLQDAVTAVVTSAVVYFVPNKNA